MLSKGRKEQKKQKMLEKCFELFVQQGLENTSLNALAAYCDTYKAAFYTYFKDKDDVVLQVAKMYMKSLDDRIQNEVESFHPTLSATLKRGFEMLSGEKNNLRYVYQVISSPKYGAESRAELSAIYNKYLGYSEMLALAYKVDHEKFRPYYLLYIATIHDYCLWENQELVKEKLGFIYDRVDNL